MNRKEMFDVGIIKPGQVIQIVKKPETRATIVDSRTVEYKGQIKTFTKWAQEMTGWTGVNIFTKVELITGERLDTLRKQNSD